MYSEIHAIVSDAEYMAAFELDVEQQGWWLAAGYSLEAGRESERAGFSTEFVEDHGGPTTVMSAVRAAIEAYEEEVK